MWRLVEVGARPRGGVHPDNLHNLQNLHQPPPTCLRSRPRPWGSVPGRPALGDVRGLENVRRRPAAARTGGDHRPLRPGARRAAVQPAPIRGGAFRAAPAGRRRLPVGHVADHGAAHSGAVARSDAPARHRRRPLVPDPAPEPLRRPRRPLPRGLLLGLVFHDARAHRKRPHRSREEYARQLCSPDRNGGAHPERQPDVLSQP